MGNKIAGNGVQLGDSVTATQNFTLTAVAADGTMKLARGNAGATTQDILTVDASGVVGVASGIKFPATQVPSADVNVLDDYEEGSFTPTATAGSGAITSYTSSGAYVKIGKVVYVQIFVSVTNNGTGATSFNIGGLPFAAAAVNTGYMGGAEVATSGKAIRGYFNSTTNLLFVNYDNTYPAVTGAAFVISGFYFA